MLKKFLKEVVVTVVGKQAEEIIDLLDAQKYINEFIIAKKLGITINQTRNILYKISDQGLVSFTRKKDKKKGWYTYFWRLEPIKCLEFLREVLIKKLSNLENQINSRETKEFYICKRCDIELSAENSLLHNFICPECGEIFTLKDNTPVLEELKKNHDKNQKELLLVEQEIIKEKQQIEKEKNKEIKKAKKKIPPKVAKQIKHIKKTAKKKKKTKKSVKKNLIKKSSKKSKQSKKRKR